MNRYILAAVAAIFLVVVSYVVNFYLFLGYDLSQSTNVWAQFGGFFGGVLNPVLSFLALILLIKSLSLQNEANISLRKELKNNEKTERVKSFESLFFNMISYQKELFESFAIEISVEGAGFVLTKVKAVLYIEEKVECLRDNGAEVINISEYLDEVDADDQMFGICRAFYIAVMMVADKLKESDGFSVFDRKSYLLSLINFTDFSQLRLVIMCIQFMDYESVKYLRSCSEFREVIEEAGLKLDLY